MRGGGGSGQATCSPLVFDSSLKPTQLATTTIPPHRAPANQLKLVVGFSLISSTRRKPAQVAIPHPLGKAIGHRHGYAVKPVSELTADSQAS